MDGNLSLILAFLVSISVVLALVIKFKLHPFLSLFIGCLLMGVCSGLDPMAIIKTSCKGFGDTMGDIGIIILLGVAMGQILHESGCTREIANTMLRLCGREKSALALNLTGYIISIPVFFDAAFVILIGLIREMAREGKLQRSTPIRVIRDGIVIYTGKLGSLKRFKDDVKEVVVGQDCGLNIESFNDIRVGDIVEGYEQVEVKRK